MGETKMKLKVTFDIDLKAHHFFTWIANLQSGKTFSTELGELVRIVFTDPKFDAESQATNIQFVMNEP
jgi:hypothetical protein